MALMVSSTDLHWAAGFIDGEGTFNNSRKTISISADQKDRWHLEKLEKIFGGKIYSYVDFKGRRYNRWYMYGNEAVVIMKLIYNIMSPRRQGRINDCLNTRVGVKTNGWFNRDKTHCKRGHPLSGDNLYLKSNGKWRECKTCAKMSRDKYYAKLKLKG